MRQTSARMLRLLALLQMQRDWTGPALADRLEVTTRTIRNDVGRLRSLGYPVHATPGVAGGYRLGAGAALPPLLLDDEEAVAVAVGLRTAADGSVSGIEEASVRALAKLEQVLPSRLRHRVTAIHRATLSIPGDGPSVGADVLTAIATAIRAHECLRFDYQSFDASPSRRVVEPHRLVHTRGRWMLVAWDTGRADWRTFRVDRITLRWGTGPRFTPREDPGGDLVGYVQSGMSTAMWHVRARLKVPETAESIASRLPPAVVVEPIDEHSCMLTVGADSATMLALWVGMLDVDFEVLDSPALVKQLDKLAKRYRQAVERSS